jgi:hypothetical protein
MKKSIVRAVSKYNGEIIETCKIDNIHEKNKYIMHKVDD